MKKEELDKLKESATLNSPIYNFNEVLKLIESYERSLEVVSFYGDKENWDMEDMSPTIWDDGQIDCGKRAREFLKEMGEL